MGLIIQIVLVLGVLAGGLFAVHSAWTGFKDHIGMPYAQAQLKADQPQIDAAKKAQTEAEGERERARRDTAACVATIDSQSKAVAESDRKAKEAIADARLLRKKQMQEATAQAPYIADLQAKAAAAPKLMACQIELATARPILQKQLRIKRGIPEPDAVTAPAVTSPALVK